MKYNKQTNKRESKEKAKKVKSSWQEFI